MLGFPKKNVKKINDFGLQFSFKGNVNRTSTVNFDAHWTSEAKKKRFSDFLSNRLVVKFLSP